MKLIKDKHKQVLIILFNLFFYLNPSAHKNITDIISIFALGAQDEA